MPGLLEDENLSLRHLPELSYAAETSSFQLPSYASRSVEDSFQIPSGSGLDLLNDSNDDFLADMAPTPAVRTIARIEHPPLTLEELTPRKAARRRQPLPQHQSPTKTGTRTPTTKRRVDIFSGDPPMTPASFEELKSKFDLFVEDKPMTSLIEEALSSDQRELKSSPRIVKVATEPHVASARVSESPPKFSPKRATPRRLTIEHLSPSKAINTTPTRTTFPRANVSPSSKRRQEEASHSPQQIPMSPMRPASKRVASAPSPVEPLPKRKAVVPTSKPVIVAPTSKPTTTAPTSKPSSQKSKPPSADSMSKEPTKRAVTRVERPKRASALAPKKPLVSKPAVGTGIAVVSKKTTLVTKPKSGASTWLKKGPAVPKESSSLAVASGSRAAKTTITPPKADSVESTIARPLEAMDTDTEVPVVGLQATVIEESSESVLMREPEPVEEDTARLDPEQPVAGPSRQAPRVFGSTSTKPEPFNFSVPSRSNSRASTFASQSRASRSTSSRVNPVPDYKALHASHNALMASRRQHVHPTIAIPLELSTESRAKERARFDEIMREKEHEQQRLEEEERRKKEAEELMELKELRKRTFVKAHEVPEWYKDAPRRKKNKVEDE